MRLTGYQGTGWEIGAFTYQPNQLSDNLSKYELDLIGAFVPVNLKDINTHLKGLSHALKVAGLMYYAGYEHAKIILSDDNGAVEARVKMLQYFNHGTRSKFMGNICSRS